MLKVSYLLMFMLCAAVCVHAQGGSSGLTGTVTDTEGQPLAAVLLYLKGTGYQTTTNEEGKFALKAPAGEYQLLVSSPGFKQRRLPVILANGVHIPLPTIIMEQRRALSEVRIQGKTKNRQLQEQPYNLNVLDTRKLFNTGASLTRALNETSGVRVREDGGLGSGFSFSLNGFTGSQVKFFLDGIPMDNFGSALTLNNFPVNMAERVEIYKGVVPIHLGADALGGAVNIVTRSNLNYLDASYGYGSFNTHKAAVNGAYRDTATGFTVRANAFLNYSDNNYKVKVQPIDLATGQKEPEQEVRRFHDSYRGAGLQLEAGITGKRFADELLIGVLGAGNQKDIQTGVTMAQVFGARTASSASVVPTLKYRKSGFLLKGLDFMAYGAYNMTRNSFIDTTRLRYNWLQETVAGNTAELSRSQLKNKDREALANANLTYHLNKHHALALNYVLTDFSRSSSDVENPENVTFLYPQQLKKQIAGLAWQATYQQFTATAFVKYYALRAQSFEQVNNGTGMAEYRPSSVNATNYGYGAAGAYFIMPQLQAKASFEHTYRLPESTELLGDGLYTRRNSALKPEQSDNYNLGVLYTTRIHNTGRISIEANYLFRNAHDFIRLDQAQTQPIDRQYINIGDVRTNGLEAEIRYACKGGFHATVNATYQSIIDRQETITSTNFQGTIITPNLGYGYRIPNTPYLFANGDVGYIFHKVGGRNNTLDVSYSVNYTHHYYFTPHQLGFNNQDEIPTQLAHNAMISYAIRNGRYNISLECRNLGDAALYDNYLLQKPGRSFFLKLRYFVSK